MKSVHSVIKLLKNSANIKNFDTTEKEMFVNSYERLHKNKKIRSSVDEGMLIVSRMIRNGWDDEMTYCSIELMNQAYNNTLYQKVLLVSLCQELEQKYFSLSA